MKSAFEEVEENIIISILTDLKPEMTTWVDYIKFLKKTFVNHEQTNNMNKIIAIGWTGSKRCYLNISREEALERYKKSEGVLDPPDVDEFEFDDEFGADDI